MIKKRCLTGLILPIIAVAILQISPVNAQDAPQEPVAADSAADATGPAQQSPEVGDDIAPSVETQAQNEPATEYESEQEPPFADNVDTTSPEATIAEQPEPASEENQDLVAEENIESDAGESEPAGGPSLADTEAQTEADRDADAENNVQADSDPDVIPAESDTDSAAPAYETNADAEAESAPSPAPVELAEPAEPALDPKDVTLKIATWGGAYGQSQQRAFFKPFTERYGYRIETVTYDGAYEDFVAQGQGETPDWSLVDMNGDAMARACDEGRLEPLGFGILEPSPDGKPLSDDFLPGAIHRCGVASVAWSAIVVYEKNLASVPTSLEDFFDTGKIPGKRLLPKQPRYSLELALMADGVAPDEVYDVLRTQDGQDRAFRKLSSIKDDIVWWEKPSEVFGRIAEREAIMGLAFNGRAFMAKVASRQPVEILWDHQIYTYNYWAVPRGAPFSREAKKFIRFATSAQPLSDQARWIPYGPSRRSAVKLVGKHGELDLEMKPFLPTHEPNFADALAFDGTFWERNETALQERFQDWAKGRQLPPQKSASNYR